MSLGVPFLRNCTEWRHAQRHKTKKSMDMSKKLEELVSARYREMRPRDIKKALGWTSSKYRHWQPKLEEYGVSILEFGDILKLMDFEVVKVREGHIIIVR